jgi:choline dehydrogenase-like flavoprotein
VSTIQSNFIPNTLYKIQGRAYKPIGAVGKPTIGQRCQGYSSCVPICPIQAKYNSMKTLTSALDTGRVDVITQAIVTKLLVGEDNKITQVTYSTYKGNKDSNITTNVARGRVFVLAAHVVENCKILLSSNIGGNLVGCYLMDHPFLLTWGLAPKPLGTYRGPGSTAGIETLRNGEFRRNRAAFRVEISNLGWSWPTGSPHSLIDELIFNKKLKGQELQNEIFNRVQREVRLGFMLDQPAEILNRITIDTNYKDSIGNYLPIINYNLSNYVKAGIKVAKDTSEYIFKNSGVKDETLYEEGAGYFCYENKGYVYQGSDHFIGGHIMGTNSKNSVVTDLLINQNM